MKLSCLRQRLSSHLFLLIIFLVALGEINLALQLRNIEIPYIKFHRFGI